MPKTACRNLTEDEVAVVLTNGFEGRFQHRNRCIFTLGLLSGFRISELLSIRIGDVCSITPGAGAKFFDRLVIDRSRMKGKKESRSVPLSVLCIDTLKKYLDDFEVIFGYPPSSKKELVTVSLSGTDREEIERKNAAIDLQNQIRAVMHRPLFRKMMIPETKQLVSGMYLFPSNKKSGKRYSRLNYRSVDLIYRNAFTKAGFTEVGAGVLSTHTCRKTFAAEMQRIHGTDLLSIQKSLGHRLITSTQAYLKAQDPAINSGILSAFGYLKKRQETIELLLEVDNTPDFT